jgi:hypothetical protein
LKSGNSKIHFKKFSSATYKKSDEKQKVFIDDLVLVVYNNSRGIALYDETHI